METNFKRWKFNRYDEIDFLLSYLYEHNTHFYRLSSLCTEASRLKYREYDTIEIQASINMCIEKLVKDNYVYCEKRELDNNIGVFEDVFTISFEGVLFVESIGGYKKSVEMSKKNIQRQKLKAIIPDRH